jgi:hypothetical protein
VSGSQISGGEKDKSAALELVESKPLEHPALLQYACTWTTTTQAARPAANFLKTRKMPRNLLICAATTQAMRISTHGSSGANRKLRPFHPFFSKIESNNLS